MGKKKTLFYNILDFFGVKLSFILRWPRATTRCRVITVSRVVCDFEPWTRTQAICNPHNGKYENICRKSFPGIFGLFRLWCFHFLSEGCLRASFIQKAEIHWLQVLWHIISISYVLVELDMKIDGILRLLFVCNFLYIL